MKTTRANHTIHLASTLAIILTSALLAAATITTTLANSAAWNGGDGNWSAATNWTPGTTPGAGDTATIAGASTDQTITYDTSSSGLLGTLTLDQANATWTNTLLVSKSLTVANDITLGGNSALGTAQLQLGSGTTLKIGDTSTRGTLTIGQNATLLATGTPTSPTIDANVILNAGGLFTLNATTASDTRTTILGNFTANGGTIERTGSTARHGLLQLKGATNTIGNITLTGAPDIYLNSNTDQTLSTDTNIALLALRAANGTKTLSGTGTLGAIWIGNYNTDTNLTIKLDSNLATTNGFMDGGWGGAPGAHLALDTNGHDFTVTNGLNFVTGNGGSVTWTLTNSATAAATISATNFIFNSASTYTLNGPLTLEATSASGNGFTFNSATINVAAPVTLKSIKGFDLAATAATNLTLAAGVTLHATGGDINTGNKNGLNIRYTGATGNLASTGTLASIEVGDGATASTLSRTTNNLTLAGNLKINTNATYVSAGRATTFQGTANLTGAGTYKAVNNTGNIIWDTGSTGGFSAGNGRGDIGTLHLSAASTVGTITPTARLSATSISTFDIASLASFDVIDLGAFGVAYNGTLELNFLNGYTPDAGDTFHLFQSSSELSNTGASIVGILTGAFATITSNLDAAGYAFAFDATSGILSVTTTPVPEPATMSALAALAALLAAASKLKNRK
ncbi:hypothetical protein OpiT1DRAFT_03598 [Opitutaceae bacterium TAV1]|nr:hypothetical protein OpiT1DRAFT_03598 [Opitutaceae bacterium TAV1]